MSLGKEMVKDNRYYYSNLGNMFTIIKFKNEYCVFFKDVDGSLISICDTVYNLEQAKENLVNWININMKIDFPCLSVA